MVPNSIATDFESYMACVFEILFHILTFHRKRKNEIEKWVLFSKVILPMWSLRQRERLSLNSNQSQLPT
ncbi:hypothetical protein L596_021896 [Steinernema carpocapsae]|uniref:Uncharacterized protein n=1 Tax=Steinernema carpocapsae TaxID=34508 RepID=A0A4U5MK79_STECR|nr:hypothetical protein L596_021896 [Steinernema carpocapsae]